MDRRELDKEASSNSLMEKRTQTETKAWLMERDIKKGSLMERGLKKVKGSLMERDLQEMAVKNSLMEKRGVKKGSLTERDLKNMKGSLMERDLKNMKESLMEKDPKTSSLMERDLDPEFMAVSDSSVIEKRDINTDTENTNSDSANDNLYLNKVRGSGSCIKIVKGEIVSWCWE